MAGQKPQPLSWMINEPIVDSKGNMSRSGIIYFQNTEKKIAQSLTLLGINSSTVIEGTSTTAGALNNKTQNLSENGTLPTASLTGSVSGTQVGFTEDNVPDGVHRFCVINGANLNGVAFVDPNKRALIDFSATGHLNEILDYLADGVYNKFIRVASGQVALGTSPILSGASATATSAAPGALTTDTILWSWASAPATGYAANASGSLDVLPYASGNQVNFYVGNSTGNTITPGAQAINWQVIR